MYGNQGGGLGFGFNPAEVPDTNNLPDGDYNVRLVGLDVKQKDDSLALVATFTVLGGNFNNRKHFERYTMKHAKHEAVEVGQRNLKKLFTALGYTRMLNTLQDIEAFKAFAAQRPIQVSVKNKGDFANINKYTALVVPAASAQTPPVADSAPAPSGWATPTTAASPPWTVQQPATGEPGGDIPF